MIRRIDVTNFESSGPRRPPSPPPTPKWFIAFFVFCLLLGLSVVGGVIFVAIHFIAKFW